MSRSYYRHLIEATAPISSIKLVENINLYGSFYYGGINYECTDLIMNNDGTKIYWMGVIVWALDLSTPYDITTATYNGERFDQRSSIGTSKKFSFTTGDKLILDAKDTTRLVQFDLSIAYQINTQTNSGISFDYSQFCTLVEKFIFINNGDKLLIFCNEGAVYFNLSSPYNISNPIYEKTISDSYYLKFPVIDKHNNSIYIISYEEVKQYEMYDVNNITLDTLISQKTFPGLPLDAGLSKSEFGSLYLGVTQNPKKIYQYNI